MIDDQSVMLLKRLCAFPMERRSANVILKRTTKFIVVSPRRISRTITSVALVNSVIMATRKVTWLKLAYRPMRSNS